MPQQRGVATVILRSILTIGFYWLYWYYTVNEEIRIASRGTVQVSPGLALLAQFIPVANVISWYNTASRLETVKRANNDPHQMSAGVTVLLAFFLPFGFYTAIVQGGLNALLHHQSRGEPAVTALAV